MKVDISKALHFAGDSQKKKMLPSLVKARKLLDDRAGPGNEFLGWLDLPGKISGQQLKDICNDAEMLSENSDFLVVVGIGGSYLGARAVIEALSHSFNSIIPRKKTCRIIYAGHTLSSSYYSELLELLDKNDYSLCVISKSGTTTEPAIAFRILKNHLEQKYGNPLSKNRIIAITDSKRGALKEVADKEGYQTYVIPDDVGGRFSVLTPVGLLPIATAGFDIEQLLKGAADMKKYYTEETNPEKNIVMQYALARNLLYQSGKPIEILANYSPKLLYFSEWWKQLFGESEGKQGKGIFPASVSFTTDLHSLGQYVQDGHRVLFETCINIEESSQQMLVPSSNTNDDGLEYIAGISLDHVNKMAAQGTAIAHTDGGVPVINITIPKLNEYYLGQMIFFFELACAISGYMLKVNPFDQEGVEDYKRNMFALLKKPGYEKIGEHLLSRLSE